MTRQLVILCQSPELYSQKRLFEEGEKKGHKVIFLTPQDIFLSYNAPEKIKGAQNPFFTNNGLVLLRDTGVRYDDFVLEAASYASDLGHKVSNPTEAVRRLRDKQNQAHFFFKNKISAIPTVAWRGKPTESLIENIRTVITNTELTVLKTLRGNQGLGVNLIRGEDSLLSLLETFWAMNDQRFILQPYIMAKKEMRLFFVKDQGPLCLGALDREISSHEFRRNAKRARPTALPIQKIPKEALELAEKAFSLSGLDYCGIDVLIDMDGVTRIIEINSIPGFEAFEKETQINVAASILKTFKE